MKVYAHTLKNAPEDRWEPLFGENGHSARVAARAAAFAEQFAGTALGKSSSLCRILGGMHDIGKATHAFQQYLRVSSKGKSSAKVDHKSVAAYWVLESLRSVTDVSKYIACSMAYAFQGHHGGLGQGSSFINERGEASMEALRSPEYQEVMKLLAGKLPSLEDEQLPEVLASSISEGVMGIHMLTRMLHSLLVDADWLATESFCDPERAAARAAVPRESIDDLSLRLESYMRQRESHSSGAINDLRKQIRRACISAAAKSPGVYKLNVPTGGGKTLSSLSFALEHARRHGKHRVIYVIPYTSIIDQTARVFREVLGEFAVLEHHSNLAEESDSEVNRFASENWEAPLIVTTNVQFFESLFASQNKRCRKLHNLVNSVIIFDEAQTLPTEFLDPCLAAMRQLEKNFGCTLLLCTATQPTLDTKLGSEPQMRPFHVFRHGWAEGQIKSLIGEEFEHSLSEQMKRVSLQFIGRQSMEALENHFRSSGEVSALFIVNLTSQAQKMYELFANGDPRGVYHLSARMCPAHRKEVLNTVIRRLQSGLPTILIATRVVEAGVDISFPVVYRDLCGLDSLAQSAGRCNRNGELPVGKIYAYEAEEREFAIPASFVNLRDAAIALKELRYMSGCESEELFSPCYVDEYFRLFFEKRGSEGVDKMKILDKIGSSLGAIFSWDFPAIADAMQIIPNGQRSILLPYGEQAEELRAQILQCEAAGMLPSREVFRKIQQLSVSIYPQEWSALSPHMEKLHGDAEIYMLSNSQLYSSETGLLREEGSSLPVAIC